MRHSPALTTSAIVLPFPPELSDSQEAEIYSCFMRHVRAVPHSRMAIKILSAIQFTADTLSCSDAHVSKTLVDLGLRAPRLAFPAEFLDFADRAFARQGWSVSTPSAAMRDLQEIWEAEEGVPCGVFSPHSVVLRSLVIVGG